ncbi:MAG: DUF1501 domain-containing protein [Opitutaceae bacterium]|nr:DUF1501 domain-containing protein [Opitutaceae bacterium]
MIPIRKSISSWPFKSERCSAFSSPATVARLPLVPSSPWVPRRWHLEIVRAAVGLLFIVGIVRGEPTFFASRVAPILDKHCAVCHEEKNYGRDHHPRCFTMWLAGGGLKPGFVYGETDASSYNIVKDDMHVRDLHATILHQCCIDHNKYAFNVQGLDQRLTGVVRAKINYDILS